MDQDFQDDQQQNTKKPYSEQDQTTLLRPLYKQNTVKITSFVYDFEQLEQTCKQQQKHINLGTMLYQFNKICDISDLVQIHQGHDYCRSIIECESYADYIVNDVQPGMYILAKQINTSIPDFLNFKNGQIYILVRQTDQQRVPYYENLYLLKIMMVRYVENGPCFTSLATLEQFDEPIQIDNIDMYYREN